MGSVPLTPQLPLARLGGVGAVVFLSNAALLVLQLVASRLLAPFIGSDLYSWTSIIGVFLTGIALGNAFGGKLADRYPHPITLAALLLIGTVGAVWMAVAPMLFRIDNLYHLIPLGVRIPLLTTVLCLPAGFALSLLTPLAIKLGIPDVSKTGRVAGLVFALSTLGCLLGNYVTGFYLIPAFTVNALVYVAAGTLLVLAAAVALTVSRLEPASDSAASGPREPAVPERAENPFAFADIRQAFAIVFLASFCGMTLELTASRLLAQHLGVSLFTWTGIIGVMLAGTALGNLTGGILADRVNRNAAEMNPRLPLAGTLIASGAATVLMFVTMAILTRSSLMEEWGLIAQVLGWTFALFFLPMFCLGMVSPQVIRLAVPDVAHVGRVAGRVYAWSTAGAILGTFATGYVLVSALGVKGVLLAVACLLTVLSLAVARVWQHNLLLYLLAIVLGGVTGGVILVGRNGSDPDTLAVLETNYYTIKVSPDPRHPSALQLTLDHLVHSSVDPNDPKFLYYEHEQVQIEFLQAAKSRTAGPKVLVIGGGGYTFPRYAKVMLPESEMDVVEIDPGVTRIAYEHLGLKREYGIRDFNMDGRQFVAERAAPHSYDLLIQDAVNDLSVPWHLLTKEYNDTVKVALKPDGVYLLTIIDEIEHGKLWRASLRTLQETFPHVTLLSAAAVPPLEPPPGASPADIEEWAAEREHWAQTRQVYVIYAADRPFDPTAFPVQIGRANGAAAAVAGGPVTAATQAPVSYTRLVSHALLEPYLATDPGVLLTDQYAPVDNLMAEVFRRR